VTTSAELVAGAVTVDRGLRQRLSLLWQRYARLSVDSDPTLTTVWVHGHCLDVSIYDRDWPESYRY
jgi:hypothetical protein